MSDFNAELYLRLLGERELASGLDLQHEQVNGRAQLGEAAAALAATGAIDAELAEAIAGDYERADVLRIGNGMHRFLGAARTREPVTALEPRRVFSLEASVPLKQAKLVVHSLTLTADGGRLLGEVHSEIPFAHGGSPGQRPPAPVLLTSGGVRHQTEFTGGWSDRHAEGYFEIGGGPLDPDLKWLEIEGTRVPLPPPQAPPAVEIERFDRAGLPARYLWQLLAVISRHPARPNLQAATDALVAAGVVAAEDPELEALAWAQERYGGHHFHPRHRPPVAPLSGEIPARVPAEWRSLSSAPPGGRGPRGSVAVGAATPAFDGVSIALNVLRSSPDSFAIEVDVAGVPHTHPRLPARFRVPLAWWACDDRGRSYLGQTGNWSGGDPVGHGQVDFGPLDPRATTLTVLPTTLGARARISIPLTWA